MKMLLLHFLNKTNKSTGLFLSFLVKPVNALGSIFLFFIFIEKPVNGQGLFFGFFVKRIKKAPGAAELLKGRSPFDHHVTPFKLSKTISQAFLLYRKFENLTVFEVLTFFSSNP